MYHLFLMHVIYLGVSFWSMFSYNTREGLAGSENVYYCKFQSFQNNLTRK